MRLGIYSSGRYILRILYNVSDLTLWVVNPKIFRLRVIAQGVVVWLFTYFL
jgi:hypothetical protein